MPKLINAETFATGIADHIDQRLAAEFERLIDSIDPGDAHDIASGLLHAAYRALSGEDAARALGALELCGVDIGRGPDEDARFLEPTAALAHPRLRELFEQFAAQGVGRAILAGAVGVDGLLGDPSLASIEVERDGGGGVTVRVLYRTHDNRCLIGHYRDPVAPIPCRAACSFYRIDGAALVDASVAARDLTRLVGHAALAADQAAAVVASPPPATFH